MARRTDFHVDRERHQYWLGERRLPSVTDVLGDLVDYSRVSSSVLEHKRQIGDAVHYAIALGNDLDPASVDPAVAPYLSAWQRFCDETGYTPIEHEQSGYHETYLYAGSWDQTGDLNGRLVLPDVKCLAAFSPITGPQTAAYAAIRDQHQRKKIQKRFTLLLKPDGKYRLIEHADSADFAVFLACLTRYNWKQKNLGD